MNNGGALPLAFMRPGESGRLVEIRGLRHHDHGGEGAFTRGAKQYRRGHLFHKDKGHRLEHRLNHMGLVPGEKVKLIQNNTPGPVIVAIKDSRICLGRGIAMRLMIEPDSEGSNSPTRE